MAQGEQTAPESGADKTTAEEDQARSNQENELEAEQESAAAMDADVPQPPAGDDVPQPPDADKTTEGQPS
jgi:hypothetical protein